MSLRLLAGLLVLGCVSAQTRYVVDAAGGPGSDFKSIHLAIQKVKEGDVLIVRKGVYGSFYLTKGLTILADPGAVVRIPSRGKASWITKVNTSVRIHGLRFEATDRIGFTPLLVLTECKGRVTFTSVTTNQSSETYTTGMQIGDCHGVTLDHCDIQHVVNIYRSTVAATETLFKSDSNPETCVALDHSKAYFTRCGATAKPGSASSTIKVGAWSFCQLAGDGKRRFVGSGTRTPVTLAGGTLHYDPDAAGTKNFASGIGSAWPMQLPWLTAAGGRIGGTLDLELGTMAGKVFRMFVGLTGPRVFVNGHGDVWIDPVWVFEFTGKPPTSGVARLKIPVPNSPGLLGLPITAQAIDSDKVGRTVLSNPATVILR